MAGDSGNARVLRVAHHFSCAGGVVVLFDPGAERLQKTATLRQCHGMAYDALHPFECGAAHAQQPMHHRHVSGAADVETDAEVIERIERGCNRADDHIFHRQHGTVSGA